MSKVFVSIALSLDGYMASEGITMHRPEYENWGSTTERIGANIVGRRMFDQGEISWPGDAPFHTSVYVLMNEKREPWAHPGGTTFHFVNDGPARALGMARESAGIREIRVAGGADVLQQYLDLGVVDELEIAMAPVLFGGGRSASASAPLRPPRALSWCSA